jgi:hypothetical protein
VTNTYEYSEECTWLIILLQTPGSANYDKNITNQAFLIIRVDLLCVKAWIFRVHEQMRNPRREATTTKNKRIQPTKSSKIGKAECIVRWKKEFQWMRDEQQSKEDGQIEKGGGEQCSGNAYGPEHGKGEWIGRPAECSCCSRRTSPCRCRPSPTPLHHQIEGRPQPQQQCGGSS